MNRATALAALLFVAACALSIQSRVGTPPAFAFSFAPPVGHTGAPDETTCAECHSGVGGDGSLAITGAPAQYSPGQTYTLTVTIQDPGQQRWGFELTALQLGPSSQSVPSGTLVATSSLTRLNQDFFNGRQYITHTSNGAPQGDPADGTFGGTTDGPVSWSFDWTAPVAGSGDVTFYAAGNAANGNGSSGAGDFIYTTTAATSEAPVAAVTATTWGKIKRTYLEP